MKVEFYRPAPSSAEGDPEGETPPPTLVGTATWVDPDVVVDTADVELRAALERAFRKTPVVTDDASYRRFGTHGEVMVQPGDLEWFRAAAFVRAPAESGLEARLVPGITEGGYDPASQYRRFDDAIERLASGD